MKRWTMLIGAVFAVVGLAGNLPAAESAEQKAEPGDVPEMTFPVQTRRTNIYYPSAALQKRIKAQVVVQLLLNLDETPSELSTVQCSTHPEKHAAEYCPFFETAAVKTVSEWRWQPWTINGEPTEAWFTVRVDFDPKSRKIRKWTRERPVEERSD